MKFYRYSYSLLLFVLQNEPFSLSPRCWQGFFARRFQSASSVSVAHPTTQALPTFYPGRPHLTMRFSFFPASALLVLNDATPGLNFRYSPWRGGLPGFASGRSLPCSLVDNCAAHSTTGYPPLKCPYDEENAPSIRFRTSNRSACRSDTTSRRLCADLLPAPRKVRAGP